MKTHYFIFLICSVLSFEGYTCGPPATATVSISGPSSIEAGKRISLTLTKSQPELSNTGGPSGIFDEPSVTWELISSTGSIRSSNRVSYNRGFNGPYNGVILTLVSLSPGTYTVRSTLSWARYTIANTGCGVEEGGCFGGSGSDEYIIQVLPTSPPPPTTDRPDLTVSVQSVPSRIRQGTNNSYFADFRVSNVGDAGYRNSQLSANPQYRVFLYPQGFNKTQIVSNNIGFLDPGESKIITFPIGTGNSLDPNLDYIIEMEVDWRKQVTESNENNNITSRVIVIDPPAQGRIENQSLASERLNDPNLVLVTDMSGAKLWSKQSNSSVDLSLLPLGEILVLTYDYEAEIVKEKIILPR